MAERPPESIDCLLFSHDGVDWLAPAALVVEVIPHFADAAPEDYEWRGEMLACRGEGRAVRALMVLRDLQDDSPGFHALALDSLPRPCRVGPAQLVSEDDGRLCLDGSPVRLYGVPGREDDAGPGGAPAGPDG